MPERFVVFDVWGDYAHFKKYYTTSSPLTFSIPPRTALIGLVSAILGLDKNEYLARMVKARADIAVRLLNPVKKSRIMLNLIDTKGGYWRPVKRGNLTGRTQIRFEVVQNPKYRIYIRHKDAELQKRLLELLSKHECVYTPCLGISEMIADFSFITEAIVNTTKREEKLEVNTVLPVDEAKEPELVRPGCKFFKERIPCEMLPGRIVTEYREVLFEAGGGSISAKCPGALELENGDTIALL